MFLSLLTKEEKFYFIDLLTCVVKVDGTPSETEIQILKKLKNEMGDEVLRYRNSNQTSEKLINYFIDKPRTTRNIVFMNILSSSLNDDWYSIEEHLLIEEIQEKFGLSDKKKKDLMKIVYADRDLREKAKRIISE